FQPISVPDISQKLAQLEAALESEPPAEKAKTSISRIPFPILDNLRARRWMWAALGAAATILLLLVTYQIPVVQRWLHYRTVSTAYGEQKHITLPDGSIAILNANSSLRFLSRWRENSERRCDLTGEAYFDVKSSTGESQSEFAVYTRDGRIAVMGTRFAVRDRGAGSRVTVEEGLVKITAIDSTGKHLSSKATAIVRPGQYVAFRRGDRQLTPHEARWGLYITWWRDHLVLREAPFREIVQRLEETYGLTIEVEDPALLDHTISGSIENRDLEIILRTLAEALQTRVEQQEGKIIFKAAPQL
ncbi:MAG: DUF4974 domain-containing protein, partial [Calditrichaeota bacterium]